MNISENILDDDILKHINECAQDGANILGLDVSLASPLQVIGAINSYVAHCQKEQGRSVRENDDLAFVLGSLWGEQLVRDLGWDWTGVTFLDHDSSKAVGVVSPDRSRAIYPFDFIYRCLAGRAPVTILLAHNMLKDAVKLPHLPARSYADVMDHIRHIVPPN